ncbi:MAG: UDP-N-acetylmuramyl-tripeptide synthetase [Myxococcota bacterium]
MPIRPTPCPVEWAEELFTFGVTGTNGKTSTVQLLASMIRATGEPGLAVNTVGTFLRGEALDVGRSAQGFVDAMARLHEAEGRHAAVECTSKSLAEGYAQRWRFDAGVFTNLSPDHQSTHGSLEHYLAAKAQLFTALGPGRTAVLNAADPTSLLLDRVIPPDVERQWYGSTTRGPLVHEAQLEAVDVHVAATGTRATLRPSPQAEALGGSIELRMVGSVFMENALAAASAGLAAGFDGARIREGLAACPAVPGRFEVFATAPVVVVDYAHSPDALERTCDAARALGTGRLWVVFGAGGGSSPEKREPMGVAVGQRADVAVVTNDNPRDESPEQIANALVAGLEAGGRAEVVVQLDRARAIEHAVSSAQPGDVVVIAGKGHETGQTLGSQTLPFSDREHVQRLAGGSA